MKKSVIWAISALLPIVTLTSCSNSGNDDKEDGKKPVADQRQSDRPKPIISEAEGRKLVENYVKVNNEANKAQDAGKIRSIEEDGLSEQSLAQFKKYPTYSEKEKKAYRKPFYYVKPSFWIPSEGNWFIANVTTEGIEGQKKYPKALIFERQQDKSWKMVHSAAYEGTLPKIEKDKYGFPQPVQKMSLDDSRGVGELDEAISDLWATGGKNSGKRIASNEIKKNMINNYRERSKGYGNCAEGNYAHEDSKWSKVYALKTSGNGALTFFTSAVGGIDVTTGSSCYITPSDQVKAFAPKSRIWNSVESTYTMQNIVDVPNKDDVKGAKILSSEVEMVDAESR